MYIDQLIKFHSTHLILDQGGVLLDHGELFHIEHESVLVLASESLQFLYHTAQKGTLQLHQGIYHQEGPHKVRWGSREEIDWTGFVAKFHAQYGG